MIDNVSAFLNLLRLCPFPRLWRTHTQHRNRICSKCDTNHVELWIDVIAAHWWPVVEAPTIHPAQPRLIICHRHHRSITKVHRLHIRLHPSPWPLNGCHTFQVKHLSPANTHLVMNAANVSLCRMSYSLFESHPFILAVFSVWEQIKNQLKIRALSTFSLFKKTCLTWKQVKKRAVVHRNRCHPVLVHRLALIILLLLEPCPYLRYFFSFWTTLTNMLAAWTSALMNDCF